MLLDAGLRSKAVFAAVLLAASLAGGVLLSGVQRGVYDFQAFYCAGTALREHADPYRAQPLGACEHALTDGTYAALPPDVVLPAPQPPYDIALFSLLSLVPFSAAKIVWGAVLGAAIAASVAALVKVTGVQPGVAFMSFIASLMLPSLAFGQFFAVYAAACCGAAFFAQKRDWAMGGVAAAASLVEPHLGLPVCITLAAWNRQARYAILGCVAIACAISLVGLGWHGCVEYVTTVLPLHAQSELGSDAQLSLSAVIHALGASAPLALRIGAASSVCATVCAVVLARTLATRFSDDAFLVAVPAALAAIGGTFIHATEMFAAIPLALLLFTRARGGRLATIALVLLAIPWLTVLEGGMPFAFPAIAGIVVFYLLWQNEPQRLANAVVVAAAAVLVLWNAPALNALLAHRVHHAAALNAADAGYPQTGWQALNERALSGGSAIAWILRMGSWFGLGAVGAAAVYALTSIDVRSNSI